MSVLKLAGLSIMIQALLITCAIHSFAQDPELIWVRQKGGKSFDNGAGVTTDQMGNVYYCGFIEDTAYFSPGLSGASLTALPGSRNIFIAKMTAEGQHIWVRGVNTYGINQAHGIKVDRWGNVYVAGQFSGTGIFGTFSLTANGTGDAFICKLDSAGNFLWVRNLGGIREDIAYAVDVDDEGNAYMAGTFREEFELENVVYKADGAGGAFVSKLDSQGNFVWVKTFGSDSKTRPNGCKAMAVDHEKNVYVVGHFMQSAINLNPDKTRPYTITTVSLNEAFITKLDSAGDFVWGKTLTCGNAASSSFCNAIRPDRFGNVYICGSFNGNVEFNSIGQQSQAFNLPYSSYYISKMRPDGEMIWLKKAQALANPVGINVDYRGAPYMLTSYTGTADMNPGESPADSFIVSAPKGVSNLLILKLDPDGVFEWAKNFSGEKTVSGYANAIHVDQNKSVYVSGWFNGNIDFDPTVKDAKFENFGTDGDIYVLKIDQSCNDTSLITHDVTLCEDEYLFDGIAYHESGFYVYRLRNGLGCDSTRILNLKLNGAVAKPEVGVDGFELRTLQEYHHYQWYRNNVAIPRADSRIFEVKENGYYKVAVENANGCSDTSEVYEVKNASGIHAPERNAAYSIYPNPAHHLIYMGSREKVILKITSVDGKLVKEINTTYKADISDLAKGLYYVFVYRVNGTLLNREKILKL